MPDPNAVAAAEAAGTLKTDPTTFADQWPRRTVLLLAILVILLALVSGVAGALTMLHFRPALPMPHFAVIDTTKIAEAVADAAKRDEGIIHRFPQRFDQMIQQLQDADPDRVILVREAVVGNDLDDLTPVFLQEIRGERPLLPRSSHAQ